MVVPTFQHVQDCSTTHNELVRQWLRANWGVIDRVTRSLKRHGGPAVSDELVRLVLYGRRKNRRVRRALIRRGANFLKHRTSVGTPGGDGNV